MIHPRICTHWSKKVLNSIELLFLQSKTLIACVQDKLDPSVDFTSGDRVQLMTFQEFNRETVKNKARWLFVVLLLARGKTFALSRLCCSSDYAKPWTSSNVTWKICRRCFWRLHRIYLLDRILSDKLSYASFVQHSPCMPPKQSFFVELTTTPSTSREHPKTCRRILWPVQCTTNCARPIALSKSAYWGLRLCALFVIKVLTVREMFGKQLMQISGMSAEKAIALLDVYPTPKGYVCVYGVNTS